MSHPPLVFAVDQGKTKTRVVAYRGSEAVGERTTPGMIGLAASDGTKQVFGAIKESVDVILRDNSEVQVSGISAGIAGAMSAPKAAEDLARDLAHHYGAPTVVASDVLTAHVGALAGRSGVVLVAGTGAVALGVDDSGTWQRIDGWGPLLGDFGSGAWIGRAGLSEVMTERERASTGASASGGNPSVSLEPAFHRMVSEQGGVVGVDPVTWLSGFEQQFRAAASFAPYLLEAAQAGSEAANRIAQEAIDHLVESASACVRTLALHNQARPEVALIGGLTNSPWFLENLRVALHSADLSPVAPQGDAISGALHMLENVNLPHERYIHRVNA